MRSTWTDSRLDDLNGRVSELDRRVDQLGGGMIAAFVTLLAAMLGLIATQL